MSKPARQAVEIKDFPGLATALDPDDAQPGAAILQTNATSEVLGELRVRSGYKVIDFEED